MVYVLTMHLKTGLTRLWLKMSDQQTILLRLVCHYTNTPHGPLIRYVKLRDTHAPGMLERFARHLLHRKPLVSDPGMHHGTWGMSGSLTRSGGRNVLGIPGACATRNFTYLVKGPWISIYVYITHGLKLLIQALTSTAIQLNYLWSQGTGNYHGCCFTSHRKLITYYSHT